MVILVKGKTEPDRFN